MESRVWLPERVGRARRGFLAHWIILACSPARSCPCWLRARPTTATRLTASDPLTRREIRRLSPDRTSSRPRAGCYCTGRDGAAVGEPSRPHYHEDAAAVLRRTGNNSRAHRHAKED